MHKKVRISINNLKVSLSINSPPATRHYCGHCDPRSHRPIWRASWSCYADRSR